MYIIYLSNFMNTQMEKFQVKLLSIIQVLLLITLLFKQTVLCHPISTRAPFSIILLPITLHHYV